MTDANLDALVDLLAPRRRLFVLTGAGLSTASGIPSYRDHAGAWKTRPPVQYREFVTSERTRRRYWSRSMIGWPRMARARPNEAHTALLDLERSGRIALLVTQNVDGLHEAAGSRNVLALHGRLADVVCLECGAGSTRADLQQRLLDANPGWAALDAPTAPDGDAILESENLEAFDVPACSACGGTLKPDVVFFGENVPKARVDRAYAALDAADAVLVAGSSLQVFSGFRFVKRAAETGTPAVAVNLGRTRADDLLALKVTAPAAAALPALVARLANPGS